MQVQPSVTDLQVAAEPGRLLQPPQQPLLQQPLPARDSKPVRPYSVMALIGRQRRNSTRKERNLKSNSVMRLATATVVFKLPAAQEQRTQGAQFEKQ
jgi:hypothetical protein